MQLYRQSETAKSWFRSDRFFTINNRWYFATREHSDVGPFESLPHAQTGLDLFIETVQSDKYTLEFAETVAKNGKWHSVHYQ